MAEFQCDLGICKHGVNSKDAICLRCAAERPQLPLLSLPPGSTVQAPDRPVTFTDAPGQYSLTQLFGGYVTRYTAPSLDALIKLIEWDSSTPKPKS